MEICLTKILQKEHFSQQTVDALQYFGISSDPSDQTPSLCVNNQEKGYPLNVCPHNPTQGVVLCSDRHQLRIVVLIHRNHILDKIFHKPIFDLESRISYSAIALASFSLSASESCSMSCSLSLSLGSLSLRRSVHFAMTFFSNLYFTKALMASGSNLISSVLQP